MKRFSLILLSLVFSQACSKIEKPGNITTKNPTYNQAYTYMEEGRIDSSFLYFNKAKEQFLLQGDSLSAGKCLLNMAIISTDKGDYLGGQELSLSCQRFFDQQDTAQRVYIRSNYNNLGIATYKLNDFANALRFYDLAITYADSLAERSVYLNNKATVYLEQRDYSNAIKIYLHALQGSHKDSVAYARALSNLTMARWRKHSWYPAGPPLLKALAIRLRHQDHAGLNASYSHLADYYEQTAPAAALGYAHKMYQIATRNQSADDQVMALQKIIKLGSDLSAKKYFAIYEHKVDSLSAIRNSAKNQFALIRYESEKNKTDKLTVENDNQAKSYQIFILIFTLIGTVATAYWLSKKRKQKQALQAQNAIRLNQLRTSKKVHDVVANGLYRVMTEIENQPIVNRDLILDKIEDLYEKSRDISYEQPLQNNRAYHEAVSEMLGSFASEESKVLIAGNAPQLWDKVTEPVFYEVMQIMQELMINMKKHSGASNVLFRFERDAEQIKIYYADNGQGMPKGTTFNNGLRNTGNRIESICGQITFDTTVQRGLKIEISFPVS